MGLATEHFTTNSTNSCFGYFCFFLSLGYKDVKPETQRTIELVQQRL